MHSTEEGVAQTEENTTHFPKGHRNVESRCENNTMGALCVKVPLTGGLLILSGSEPVARKRGGGGYVFETVSSAVQNSKTRERRSPIACFGGSGARGVRDNLGYRPTPPVFLLYINELR